MKLRFLFIALFVVFSIFAWANLMIMEEDFEDGNIPAGWTQEYVSGSIDWDCSYGGYNSNPEEPHSGNYNAFFFNEDSDPHVTRLITPAFNLNPESITVLSFWYTCNAWVGFQDELRVYYRIGETSEWQLLEAFVDDIDDWTQVSYSLPEAGDDMQFCFEGTAMWGYGICLDDVVVMDDVLRIFVWNHDNNSHYTNLDTGSDDNCERGITDQLDILGLEYTVGSTFPDDSSNNYDLIFVELGLYCVG